MIENLNNALNYIEDNLSKEISLDNIAKASYYSKTYLSKLFNYVIGLSISDYVNKRRLSNSAIMLFETNKSIKYISDSNGFKSPKYFSTLFKREIGVSPSIYRKENGFIYVFPRRIIKGGSNKIMTKLKDAVYEIDLKTKDMKQFEITIEKDGEDLSDIKFKASIDRANENHASVKVEVE